MAITADSPTAPQGHAGPPDRWSPPSSGWRLAPLVACLVGLGPFAMMLASADLLRLHPGRGDALLLAVAVGLAGTGIVWKHRAGAGLALRVACAMALLAGATALAGALGLVPRAVPDAGVAVACAAVGALGWRWRVPAGWRLSDTFLAFGAAIGMYSLLGWGDPAGRIAAFGTGYPLMRPTTAWTALMVALALWLARQRLRPIGWLVLALAAVPLALTFLGKVGLAPAGAGRWLWSLGLLARPDDPLVGVYSDIVLLLAGAAAALRLHAPARAIRAPTALARGLGVTLAAVTGMAVIGLLATLGQGDPASNLSLGASAMFFALGAAIAVDRDGGRAERWIDALPLVLALAMGTLLWWSTTGDRGAFEQRVAASELAQLEALLQQDLAQRTASIGRLGHLAEALSGPGAAARFEQQAADLARQSAGFVHARARTADGLPLRWGDPPVGAPGPPTLRGTQGQPVREAVPGGWWIVAPGPSGLAAFVDLRHMVGQRLEQHRAGPDGAPVRLLGPGRRAGSREAVPPIAVRGVDLDGHHIDLEMLPGMRLAGFVLSRTAVVGAVSAGLLVSFVIFLVELARARARALVRESQGRLEASEELARAAGMDGVTGLARFSARASALAATLDADDSAGWLILVDLDAFGSLNDALGHEAGDEILRVLARRMAAECRDGGGELLRFGGEGFALVGTCTPGVDALRERAERLRSLIGEPVELVQPPQHVKVTASIGIAGMPEHGTRLKGLLRSADLARLAAKRAGRNQTRVARATTQGEQQDRLAMTAALREAIELGQIGLVYQPIVDVGSGRITGFEALARWSHPQWGHVPPAQFIPLAEAGGLMERLGAALMRSACAQLRHWRELGHGGLSMSVNVSPSQFGQGSLPGLVTECMMANGLEAGSLTLEVTEGMLIEDVMATAELLEQLKRLGVRLALDDFGTGYSSLAYLQRLPLDVLKIDRSFVSNLVDSENDAAIVRMIMGLAAQMRLQVVAEGVEDAAQRERLQALGCSAMQGYHFARPCPAAEAGELLRKFNGPG